MFDLVIISYNNKTLTSSTIESALNNTVIPENIIIVDNASTDGTVPFIKERFPQVKIIENTHNLGYSRAVNIGVEQSKNNYVVISNNDVIFAKTSFEKMLEAISLIKSNFGVIGFLQYYPNGKPQFSYSLFSGIGDAVLHLFFLHTLFLKFFFLLRKFNLSPRLIPVGYVDGAAMCVNREAFKRIDGFDASFFFIPKMPTFVGD
ncbi:MAG: glycosyltransferase family 2 protein [Ignavibacteria bacterium]|nr:glycosyltransferase family 2 protein [Ignavibacteria bacterium]